MFQQKQIDMTTLEISIRDARVAQNIINDMRHLNGLVNWTSTTSLEIEDEELAEDLVEELERLEIEVECYY